MENFLLNTTEQPISKKHISWMCEESNSNSVTLFEIIESTYRHPQAPNNAIISKLEKIKITNIPLTDRKSAPIVLLKNALDNCSLIFEECKLQHKPIKII